MKNNLVQLATLLHLNPLDRVQINNKKEIDEFFIFGRRGASFDLPFFYFQRILPSGIMEVRSPGGYATTVSPEDICDIIHAEAVTVRAMPRVVLMEHLKLSVKDQQNPVPLSLYAEADVLFVSKDKWGRVDQATVWFKDESFNQSDRATVATIWHEDRALLKSKAKRTVMPVQKYRSAANYSADAGIDRSRDYARRVVNKMFTASMNGCTDTALFLSTIGDKQIKSAALAKLVVAV